MFTWIRHWPRHALVVFAVALTLFAFGCWRTWALIVAQPRPTVDFLAQLNELVASDQPEGENAWLHYVALVEEEFETELEQLPESERYRSLRSSLRDVSQMEGSGSPELSSEMEQVVRDHASVLRRLDEAASKPGFWPSYKRDVTAGSVFDPSRLASHMVLEASPPAFHHFFTLSTLNIVRLHLAIENEDWSEAERAFATGVRFGIQFANCVNTFDLIQALAAISRVRVVLTRALDERDVPLETCERLIQIIDQNPVDGDRLIRRAIEANQIGLLDLIQLTHTRTGVPLQNWWDFWIGANSAPFPLNRVTRLAGPWSIGRSGAIRHAQQVKVKSLAAMNLPPDLLPRRVSYGRYSSEFHPIVSTYEYNPELNAERVRQLESILAGLRVMLRLEIYEHEHGFWPEALTDAMSAADAADPSSGRMFVYERTQDGASVRPYALLIPWFPATDVDAIVNPPREPLTAPRFR